MSEEMLVSGVHYTVNVVVEWSDSQRWALVVRRASSRIFAPMEGTAPLRNPEALRLIPTTTNHSLRRVVQYCSPDALLILMALTHPAMAVAVHSRNFSETTLASLSLSSAICPPSSQDPIYNSYNYANPNRPRPLGAFSLFSRGTPPNHRGGGQIRADSLTGGVIFAFAQRNGPLSKFAWVSLKSSGLFDKLQAIQKDFALLTWILGLEPRQAGIESAQRFAFTIPGNGLEIVDEQLNGSIRLSIVSAWQAPFEIKQGSHQIGTALIFRVIRRSSASSCRSRTVFRRSLASSSRRSNDGRFRY
jgi:hypothetical protein